jgi:AAA ATPase domain
MLWPDEQISAISAALEAARSGQPTVLSVLGRPGMGKTSLLREIAVRASGFNILEADGQESAYREPFDLLRQLGVLDVRPRDATRSGAPGFPLVSRTSAVPGSRAELRGIRLGRASATAVRRSGAVRARRPGGSRKRASGHPHPLPAGPAPADQAGTGQVLERSAGRRPGAAPVPAAPGSPAARRRHTPHRASSACSSAVLPVLGGKRLRG